MPLFIGKFYKGKMVKGQWVFGGVERDSGKCFLIPVEDRTANTLIEAILKWIKPNTVIYSDCWKSYNTIK